MKNRKQYDHQSLHEERMYGFFWYDWLWRVARPALICLSALILIIGIGLTGWNMLGEKLFLPVDPQDQTPVTFVVESGSSLTSVTNNLEAQGLIRSRTVLKYLMDFRGLSQKVQKGEYTLTRAMTLGEIIDQLTTGDGNPLVRDITIIPGWNVDAIADYLVGIGAASSREAFLAACNDAATYGKYYYIDEILGKGSYKERRYLLEGYLAPDTYEIYTTATLENIMQKLVSQVEVMFNAEYHARAEELGMTMDEVITLASMIQLEAKNPDFAKVSAVFHGRLRRDMTLGSDVTVKYYSHSEKMALTTAETQVDSPYNTYKRKGLPVGPICSPSREAIRAALYPDEEFMAQGYLYFCSKSPEDGSLHFSKTLEEHEAAVAAYRPLWLEYDRKRGI
ncbi:MAG: endolytic transglycosylase MltG [Firmicutes bacterium]|nr:endolytic transglycosylase MltG [Bacillota bacterium]